MTATAVRSRSIPSPRAALDSALDTTLPARPPGAGRAVAYQRVLHQLVRRELRMLGELATWAPDGESDRTATLTRHAELIGRVLLHHHAVERDAVWPALLRSLPAERLAEARAAVEDWAQHCARIDHMLRDVGTAARQWRVSGSAAARGSFATACRELAGAVESQTRAEERALLPLIDTHLDPEEWAAITRSSQCRLTPREHMLVLGLALEDACAGDRARLLGGLPRASRAAWRLSGGRHYRAMVVRLRGEPPAA
jgi:hypothetical protein